jgi:hypothetical protein
MRSGWPHSGDGQGIPPADQRHVPFGQDVSWPTGHSDAEYQNGDYRYAAPQAAQPPAAQSLGGSQGAHPYAAFNAAGYGDDGYRDPGYQGPAAQDAGIAGTRTVRGFVEPGQSYAPRRAPEAGYDRPGYQQQGYGQQEYGQQGYAGSSYAPPGQIEMAYPPAADSYHGADLYKQPWDYDQPLRYEGEEDSYPLPDTYQQPGGYASPDDYASPNGYGNPGNDGAVRYQPPAFDPAGYNGSDYSMPGVNGPGYDLSGIIGTSDFEVPGFDEPSYRRLSYDDPRYEETPGYPGSRSRFDETRFDVPRFDETRLDNLWLASDDVRREAEPAGYGNDGFGDSRTRSGYSADFDRGQGARFDETRHDMSALAVPSRDYTSLDYTRFDVPAFDETRLDNLRSFTPVTGPRPAAAAVLAPPAARPRSWAEDTSLDHFADLDLTDEPVPAAFTRTLERPVDRPQRDDDTGARRAAGRRRGRSGDRRQWMALGAIAVVAAGAIGGVLMKYVFSGPSGPAHQVVAPQTVDGFTRSANLEKQMQVGSEAQKVAQASDGQASHVISAVYQQGSISPGSNAQIFMFVGGNLAGADPSVSVANFEQTYQGAASVSPGSLGGEAACTETHLNGQSASMCVWFDNDTFGTVVSPTMTTAKLAATMDAVRPSLEQLATK